MQLREDVYNWLVGLRIIANDGKRYMDKVEVSKGVVSAFESGLHFGKLLRELNAYRAKAQGRPQTPLTKLDTLKEVSSAASRLYNWNIIVEEYAKLGIKIDQDTKALILSGDTEMIHELLKEVYAVSVSFTNPVKTSQSYADLGVSKLSLEDSQLKSPPIRGSQSTKSLAQQKMQNAQQQVDLSKLDAKKDLNRSSNCLEFFIVALAKHLQLTTKQAASLFTNNNKYVAHIIAKGVKGVFEPIIAFYQEIYANSNQLVKLFLDDQSRKSLVFSLSALKAGLISKSFEVAQWSTKLYTKLASDFIDSNQILHAWDWFVNEEAGGLNTALMGMRRHPDLREQIVGMILQFARFNFTEVFTNGLKKALPDLKDQIYAIEQLFKPLSENRLSQDELLNSGLLDEWVDLALQVAEGEFKHPVDMRIAALSFATEVWMTFPPKLEDGELKANTLITLLKRGSRDKSTALALCCLNNLFKLLNFFGSTRNAYAPVVYKNLSLSVVENHQNSVTREFILHNFIATFQKIESIPFNVLIEPLVKQVQLSDGVTYLINTFDMQFFQAIAASDRLGVKNAIQLLDLLAKVFLNNNVYASTSQDIILNVLSKHIENPTMQEFILKFVKIALAMFYASEKKKKPKERVQPLSYLQRSQKLNDSQIQGNQEMEREVLQAQKRAQIVEIIRTIVQLQQGLLNDKIKPLVAHTNIQIKQFSKKNSKGMLVILSLFGNPDRIIEQYEIEFHNHQAKLKLEEEEHMAQSGVNQSAVSVGNVGRSLKMDKAEQYSLASLKQSQADPKTLIKLESIKRTFMEKVHSKVSAEEELKELTEKQKQSLRKQLEKRSIEQGISTKNKKDVEAKLIFKDGTREKEINKEKKHGLPDLEVTDLELEEDRDKLMIEMELHKYHKLIKYLFVKYANTGHTNKKFKDFGGYQDRADTISIPEMWNLVKDFQLDARIPKDEIPALARAISLQILKDKSDVQTFYFDGFKHFLVQFAILLHAHTEKNLKKYLSPVVALQKLIQLMRQVTAAKGDNTQLFDDPDSQYFQETEVIKEYNAKLQADPKYPLPEGYKAVTEPKISFKYDLLAKLNLSEAQQTAYETLNDILSGMFGFQLLEPTTLKETVIVCRPNIFGHVQSKLKDRLKNGPLYMQYEKDKEAQEEEEKKKLEEEEKKRKDWEQTIRERKKDRQKKKEEKKREKADPKYTKQILDRYTASAGGIPQPTAKHRVLDIDVFHKASFGIRLGISKIPYKDRGIAEQVAIVIDDLIFAVETNKPTISRNIPIVNKIVQTKEKKAQFDQETIEKNKEKFETIKKFMKGRLEAIRKKKEAEKPVKEAKEKELQDKKEARLKKKQDERKQHLDDIKKAVNDHDKKTEEDRVKKEQEERDKKIAELEEKKKKFKEFNDKKKEEFANRNTLKKKLKTEKQDVITEKEKKDQEILKKLRQLLEMKGQKIQDKEKDTHQTISARFQEKAYQDVFKKHNFKLSYFFELLQMEFFHPIEYCDNKDFIPLRIWMWLGERFNLYPEILKLIDYVRIFNWLTHMKQTGKQALTKSMQVEGKPDQPKPTKEEPNIRKDQPRLQLDDYEDPDDHLRSKNPKMKPPVGLNYQEFLQALLRVSIKGANVFNRIAEQMKKSKLSEGEMKDIVEDEKLKHDEAKEGAVAGDKPQPVKRQNQTREQMKEQIKKDKVLHDQRLKEALDKLKDDKELEKKALLLDNYKYLEESNVDTLDALIYYLCLPDDKIGIELRFRMAIQEQESQITDKDRKKQLIAKLDQDLDKWDIEQKLSRTKSPGKAPVKRKKPQKLFDPYAIPKKPTDSEEQKEPQGEGVPGEDGGGEGGEGGEGGDGGEGPGGEV